MNPIIAVADAKGVIVNLKTVYRPRSPQKSLFYQCIADHFEEFEQAYDERFERKYGFWRPVICEVIQKYLEFGDLIH